MSSFAIFEEELNVDKYVIPSMDSAVRANDE